jgi:hypothetical protein
VSVEEGLIDSDARISFVISPRELAASWELFENAAAFFPALNVPNARRKALFKMNAETISAIKSSTRVNPFLIKP